MNLPLHAFNAEHENMQVVHAGFGWPNGYCPVSSKPMKFDTEDRAQRESLDDWTNGQTKARQS